MSSRHVAFGSSRALGLIALVASLAACSPPPASPPADTTPAAAPASAPAAAPGGTVTPPTTDAEMIASAMSAAPMSVAKDATISTWDMRGLRVGRNGWTCLPDGPSPHVDPMCLDKNGSEWAMALMHKTTPPKDKMGFGYMLMGGSDASNTDPFATEPKAGAPWIDTGPHVMVLNIADRFDGYPTTPDDPTKPYVMWAGTPYAHLMIPVK
jgi:hypothetical protein